MVRLLCYTIFVWCHILVVRYHLYGEIASLVLLDLISAQVINYYLVHISARHVHYVEQRSHIFILPFVVCKKYKCH